MGVAIKVNNLTKRFPRSVGYRDLLPWRKREYTVALDSLQLEINEQELFGLLGPNGAGKTTLIKILCGLILPTSGNAWILGHNVQTEEKAAKELVGVVSADERSFYWRLSGRQNLEFYASLYRVPHNQIKQRIREVLSKVGLSNEADIRFQNYSTGMRQKLAIARGLLCKPKVLFVDEPTRSLDPLSARAVRSLLREEVDDFGRTVILATHNMEEAETICDRVAIMNKGSLITSGRIEELDSLFRRQDGCELEIGNADETIIKGLSAIEGVLDCSKTPSSNGTLHLQFILASKQDVLPRVIKQIVLCGGEVHDCRLEKLPLEEIFVKAINTNSKVSS
jgi:ABC-2 type transport system ATP-binding protein